MQGFTTVLRALAAYSRARIGAARYIAMYGFTKHGQIQTGEGTVMHGVTPLSQIQLLRVTRWVSSATSRYRAKWCRQLRADKAVGVAPLS